MSETISMKRIELQVVFGIVLVLCAVSPVAAAEVAGVRVGDFLDYTIPNPPATVHDLLLQKSNGTFELVVWNERADGTDSVTVNLAGTHASVKVYDPTTDIAPIQILTDVRLVSLSLSDHPVIIEME